MLRSLIWCVGVRADQLVDGLDLKTNRGRLVVDAFMSVPGAPDIYVCGDCAAVPDLTRPGEICGMTAQHAVRQGRQVARNHWYRRSGRLAFCRVERAADLGHDPLAHRQRHPEGEPLSGVAAPSFLYPGERAAEGVVCGVNRLGQKLAVG